MRIVFVCSSVDSVQGGIETTVRALASELSNRHDVIVVAGRGRGASLHREGVRTFRLPFLSRLDPLSRRFASISGAYNPYFAESVTLYVAFMKASAVRHALAQADVISLHTKYDSLFFSRWARARDIPSVFHIQGSRFGSLFRGLDQATRYVAVSEYAKQAITAHFGLHIDQVVSPGVPQELLEQPRQEEDIVLFVARLQSSKGIIDAVHVFAELSKQFPALQLVVVGDGPERTRMESAARVLGVEGRVAFLGALPQHQVFAYYSRAKLLLFPSRAEVFGMVPLEAMAAGCPVIAGELPALYESTGGFATLLPIDDRASWVDAARHLLESPEERNRTGALGRSWARNHSWARRARDYEAQLRATSSVGVRAHREESTQGLA